MESVQDAITLKQNIEVCTIDMACQQCCKDNPDLKVFVRDTVSPVTLKKFLARFSFPVEFLEAASKWKKKLGSYTHKLPYFIVFVSLVEIIFYCAAGERLKKLLIYDAENKEQFWRFVTYMLLHTDPVHLGLNVIIQGFLGIPLEFEQGRLQCAAVYIGGGLAGSVGASVFTALSLMAGASGGIYALLLSQIPNTVLNYETIKYAGYRIVTVVTLAVADVIYVFYHFYYYNNESPRIGWVAHASGAVAGLLLGFLIFRGTLKWKRRLQAITCIPILIICVLGVTRIIYFDYFIGLLS